MTQPLRQVMTEAIVVMPSSATLIDAAREMRERDIGDVIVVEGDRISGILTDRDIVVRAVADEMPMDTSVGGFASSDLVVLDADADVEEAVRLMRERAVRRIPVVEEDVPVGIVSIGDLAVLFDEDSALADISGAEPNG